MVVMRRNKIECGNLKRWLVRGPVLMFENERMQVLEDDRDTSDLALDLSMVCLVVVTLVVILRLHVVCESVVKLQGNPVQLLVNVLGGFGIEVSWIVLLQYLKLLSSQIEQEPEVHLTSDHQLVTCRRKGINRIFGWRSEFLQFLQI